MGSCPSTSTSSTSSSSSNGSRGSSRGGGGRDVGTAAQWQAHLQEHTCAAAAQAAHRQLARQLAGRSTLDAALPAQQGLQQGTCAPSSGHPARQAGLDLMVAAISTGSEPGGVHNCTQAAHTLCTITTTDCDTAHAPGASHWSSTRINVLTPGLRSSERLGTCRMTG